MQALYGMVFSFAPLAFIAFVWIVSCLKVVNEYERLVVFTLGKVIAAEGELLASRQLLEAANTLSQNPAAMQMRYLQTLTEISVEKNSTIIFPLPIELMKVFEKLGANS
jgi:regulator of protease activity HflC (stomatin/prohibitin superfamily)